jgi:hypothetical protein
VHRFLQWIHPHDAQRGLDGGIEGIGPDVLAQEPGQPSQGQLAQPLALERAPLLERRLVEAEPLEQIARVESSRALQRLRRASGDRLLEARHVHGDHGRVERDGVLAHEQNRRVSLAEAAPHRQQGLPEAVPGLGLGRVTPEERGQLLARVEPAGR